MIARLKRCACDHLGGSHRDDGTCTRCDCQRFRHPMVVRKQDYAVAEVRNKSRRRVGPTAPWRDSL